MRKGRAGDATRTRDIFLGKEVLYQLSYTRVEEERKLAGTQRVARAFFRFFKNSHFDGFETRKTRAFAGERI